MTSGAHAHLELAGVDHVHPGQAHTHAEYAAVEELVVLLDRPDRGRNRERGVGQGSERTVEATQHPAFGGGSDRGPSGVRIALERGELIVFEPHDQDDNLCRFLRDGGPREPGRREAVVVAVARQVLLRDQTAGDVRARDLEHERLAAE